MKILIVEDNDDRCKWFKKALIGDNVDFAYTAVQGIEFLKKNIYDRIFLDHDLKFEHYAVYDEGLILTPRMQSKFDDETGYAVVQWMIENTSNKDTEVIIHSLNEAGSQRMYNRLKLADYDVKIFTFLQLQAANKI